MGEIKGFAWESQQQIQKEYLCLKASAKKLDLIALVRVLIIMRLIFSRLM